MPFRIGIYADCRGAVQGKRSGLGVRIQATPKLGANHVARHRRLHRPLKQVEVAEDTPLLQLFNNEAPAGSAAPQSDGAAARPSGGSAGQGRLPGAEPGGERHRSVLSSHAADIGPGITRVIQGARARRQARQNKSRPAHRRCGASPQCLSRKRNTLGRHGPSRIAPGGGRRMPAEVRSSMSPDRRARSPQGQQRITAEQQSSREDRKEGDHERTAPSQTGRQRTQSNSSGHLPH
jgi:hypothetical protein